MYCIASFGVFCTKIMMSGLLWKILIGKKTLSMVSSEPGQPSNIAPVQNQVGQVI